ncbi:hypothetical protein GCM10027059_47060 [Myceligenerans halotolerans]
MLAVPDLSPGTARCREAVLDRIAGDDGLGWYAVSTGRVRWSRHAGTFGAALALADAAIDEEALTEARVLVASLVDERPRSPRARDLLGLLEAASANWPAARKHWRLAARGAAQEPAELRSLVDRRVRLERSWADLRTSISENLPLTEATEHVHDACRRIRHGAELVTAVETLVVEAVHDGTMTPVRPVLPAFRTAASRTAHPGTAADITRRLTHAQERAHDADFADALTGLTTEPPAGLLRDATALFLIGRLLSARSRYDDARDVLGLVSGPPSRTGRALVAAARLDWVEHRYDEGIARASRVTRPPQVARSASRLLAQLRDAQRDDHSNAVPGGVAHVAFHVAEGGNFGDVALTVAARASIERVVPDIAWRPFHAHQVVDEAQLERLNAQRAVVVGGGGLFLPDTAPNGNSGWQWNIGTDVIPRIKVPTALFGVGYNLFPGQFFPGSLFRNNLLALAEHARFIGLRNHGSIERVRDMLPASLHEKVCWVPCATTVLDRVRPPAAGTPASARSHQVLLNVAYDRSARRFGTRYPEFLTAMAEYVRRLRSGGADVALAAHLTSDEQFVQDLGAEHDLTLDVERLYRLGLDEALATYRNASLTIGMRGHATMVSFGLGTPVLGIVSHPKVRYFLEDIGRPEWAVEVDEPHLADVLLERTFDALGRESEIRSDIAGLQQPLLERVLDAAQLIGIR